MFEIQVEHFHFRSQLQPVQPPLDLTDNFFQAFLHLCLHHFTAFTSDQRIRKGWKNLLRARARSFFQRNNGLASSND
jgi:hypothetical protein